MKNKGLSIAPLFALSALITMSPGTTYTLAESVTVRYGRDVPKVGDEMILWINEYNDVLEASKKGPIIFPLVFCPANLSPLIMAALR